MAEKLIVALCVLVLVFGVSYDLGQRAATEALATQCIPQANEKLTATIQSPGMVTCVFAQYPYRAITKRRAT